MQGLTIAIFWQKLNFFFGKIFSILRGGIENVRIFRYLFFCFCQMFLVSLIFLFLQIFFVR